MTDKEQNPFNEKVDCVKCGNEWCGVEWKPFGFVNPSNAGHLVECDDQKNILIHGSEHLEKTCTRCGYKWKEKCLDS